MNQRKRSGKEPNGRMRLFFAIPYFLYGSLLIIDTSPVLSVLGVVLLVSSIVLRWIPLKDWLLNFYFSGAVFFTMLTAIECFTYFFQANQFHGFNKSCASFDPVSGYRWFGEDIRMVRFAKGIKIYDNTFSPNNYGYPTLTDFYSKKQDSSKTRLVLLGDSFSAGSYLRVSMPDRLQDYLIEKDSEKGFEVYPFVIDGGGLHNWHSIFFREIVPNFEFDALIIPVFVDNLYREFSIQHTSDSAGFFKRFSTIPVDRKDFENNYLPKMGPKWMVNPDKEIDRLWNSRPVFKLYFLRMILNVLKTKGKSTKLPDNWEKTSSTIDELKENIGIERFKRFEEIIFYCKKIDLPVILACVPEHIRVYNQEDLSADQKDLVLISSHFGLPHFNGYEIFNEMTEEEIRSHYLKYDGHWNQKGADFFAAKFSKFILDSRQNDWEASNKK